MRKSVLVVAVALAAALSASPSYAAKKADPAIAAQQNTNKFISDAMNPYGASQKAAKPAKKKMAKRMAKKSKKKK